MGYPFIIPGSTHIDNNVPLAIQTTPGVRTFIDVPPTYDYVVEPGDTIASVCRKLFGVNTRHYRDMLRMQGFEEGARMVYHGDFTNYLQGKADDNGTD